MFCFLLGSLYSCSSKNIENQTLTLDRRQVTEVRKIGNVDVDVILLSSNLIR